VTPEIVTKAAEIPLKSSFRRHFGEKPKIEVFLSPVFPLQLEADEVSRGPA